MKKIAQHRHIVSILGCITRSHPVCLIVEYCENGDLLHYLRKNRPAVRPFLYVLDMLFACLPASWCCVCVCVHTCAWGVCVCSDCNVVLSVFSGYLLPENTLPNKLTLLVILTQQYLELCVTKK